MSGGYSVLRHEVLQAIADGHGHIEEAADRTGCPHPVAAAEVGALYVEALVVYGMPDGYSVTTAGAAQLAAWDRAHGPVAGEEVPA